MSKHERLVGFFKILNLTNKGIESDFYGFER